MSFFDRLLPLLGRAVGTYFGGPVGGELGGQLGGTIGGGDSGVGGPGSADSFASGDLLGGFGSLLGSGGIQGGDASGGPLGLLGGLLGGGQPDELELLREQMARQSAQMAYPYQQQQPQGGINPALFRR